MGCITCRMAVITPREFAGRNVDLVRHQWSRVLDVERDAVHDVRVALRRIRAATRTLSDASAKEIDVRNREVFSPRTFSQFTSLLPLAWLSPKVSTRVKFSRRLPVMSRNGLSMRK